MANAAQVYAALTDSQKAAHQTAWTRIESFVETLASRPVKGCKPKSFEVHHAIEHARKEYFKHLAMGYCAFDCERYTRALYPNSES